MKEKVGEAREIWMGVRWRPSNREALGRWESGTSGLFRC